MPPNLGPDHRFGSALSPNFEPDFGQVLKSSGPNRGSELDWGISNCTTLSEYDQFLLEEPKTVPSPALSLCATSADSFGRTTEPDGRIARPLPEQDQCLQDQTSQSAPSTPLPPLCHADLPVLVLLQVPLGKFFPEYTAGPDNNKAAKYILCAPCKRIAHDSTVTVSYGGYKWQ